ncbi:unnamed protein product [Plutella xylostella]|uniref:(diamondback moth) hypothetical protein n=1 Tax=Plutella xylostella TaxID=51655 RepID=A0A8S4EJP1_PLUXY|nr:unnamed protein product [Plutella xylostella]
MRHVFLFDKMLLVTKSREDGILAYKSHIMCNNLMLVESIEGAPLSFHVIPWDAPRQLLTLQARDKRHKREWTLLLKRVILENYNAVIPSHARQLLMQLGQNKTDDDILAAQAAKSHNLITQASMRKQLSAPEYLEKRKLEKDRRKTFDTRGRAKKGNRNYTLPLTSCDCAQVSAEKGIDYTCEICYIDLCSDCELEVGKGKDFDDQCIDCDRLNYLGVGSVDNLTRKADSDFKSSVESVSKDGVKFLKAGYHSDPNADDKSLTDANSLIDIRSINKSCLKCSLIKENIPTTDNFRSRCVEVVRNKDTLRSKSRDDPQRSRLSKIGTWRRKSEPNRQQVALVAKRSQEGIEKGMEKCEFLCRNCGSNKINKHDKHEEVVMSDPELDDRKRASIAQNLEIKMYNTKHIPKKISKLKKNRAKGRNTDTTAKFYADLSKDEFTKNVLHITESNDSLNVDTTKNEDTKDSTDGKPSLSKDESIDEETYKKLIEKTDSFKKNELEKVKFLNKQKVINENSPSEEKGEEIDEKTEDKETQENTEEAEQPLEHIISQLLLQNREFQKILKKQQARSSQKRHQMLLKSHSYPEQSPKSPSRKNSEGVIERPLSPPKEIQSLEEDHIYETLRVVDRVEETLHTLDTKSKSIQHRNSRNSRIPSPTLNLRPTSPQNINFENIRNAPPDSDYVYLTFNKLQDDIEGIYDVPIKSPEKVVNKQKDKDYYVTMQNQSSPIKDTEDIYDKLVPVTKIKEAANENQGDYLPMSPEAKSPKQGGPNTPEKWLSDQKDHFNVPRDRKSGSLPRSFQVGSPEDVSLSTFKSKPTSKSYLNRDGKVINSDRPYTIASDQGEIRYENAENYVSEESMTIAKMNLKDTTTDVQNISKSTLELEEEIDRCYKNNFETVNLDSITTENLDVFEPNLNVSTTSSCEAYTDKTEEDKAKDIDLIHHPEHKIYKPTSNMLSLKNVLSRFKSRPDKSNDDSTDAHEQSPENLKTDVKISPNEKRSGLNPRSYSKNLLQRFRSIIGDEHPDDASKTKKTIDDIQSSAKTDIKVVITSTDSNPTVSVATNDALSKSVCENTTLSLSQSEKHNLEILSHSCDNINQQMETHTHKYDRSQSTTVSNTTLSPSKSNSSFQSLNKLPIYMQGSRHLGARIAQSDYVDPKTLVSEKTPLKSINVLINKNAVRPDSLFSNASFVTSSSEGNIEGQKSENYVKEKTSKIADATISDESYYEKSFEKIEKLLDDDAFRDSAVYSDHEDTVDSKDAKRRNLTKTVTTIEHVKRTSSFKSEQVSIKTSVTDTKSNVQSRLSYTSKMSTTNNTEQKPKVNEQTKPKTAPPVPVKPKLTHLPTPTGFQSRVVNKHVIKSQETTDTTNVTTIKRNISMRYVKPDEIKQTAASNSEKVEAKPQIDIAEVKTKAVENIKETPKDTATDTPQLKRNTFDRASLDSAIRKTKPNVEGHTKSVLERRMEIESLTKAKFKPAPITKKPSQIAKPKGTTSKVAPYERSTSEFAKSELKSGTGTEPTKANIPIEITSAENEDSKGGSWVKTVVNKFQ